MRKLADETLQLDQKKVGDLVPLVNLVDDDVSQAEGLVGAGVLGWRLQILKA